MNRKLVIHVGRLRKSEAAREYEKELNENQEEWKDAETEDVEADLGSMEVAVKEEAQEVRSMKCLGWMNNV